MIKIIELFQGSPRLSINIIKKKFYKNRVIELNIFRNSINKIIEENKRAARLSNNDLKLLNSISWSL